MTQPTKFYSEREERANYISHGAGIVMAAVATGLFIYKVWGTGDWLALIAYMIFSIGMFACMSASTYYHYEQHPNRKARLRHFDHASIYLLIAASYAPFSLILLRSELFWSIFIFSLVWIIAAVGITLSFRELKRNSHIKTASYVLMGLVVLIAFKPLIAVGQQTNSMPVIYWLIGGGVFYIVGAVIYALAKREFVHAVFHIFVLLGMASHIIAAYLIPIG